MAHSKWAFCFLATSKTGPNKMEKHVCAHLFRQLKHSPMVNIFFKGKRMDSRARARARFLKPFKYEFSDAKTFLLLYRWE